LLSEGSEDSFGGSGLRLILSVLTEVTEDSPTGHRSRPLRILVWVLIRPLWPRGRDAPGGYEIEYGQLSQLCSEYRLFMTCILVQEVGPEIRCERGGMLVSSW